MLLTIQEAADHCSIAKRTYHKWADEGKVPRPVHGRVSKPVLDKCILEWHNDHIITQAVNQIFAK